MEKKIYGVEEFLSRPMKLEEEIRGDIDHIASLRSIVEKTTTQLSFTAGRNPSKNEKTFENVMIQISEEEEALEEKKKELVSAKVAVEDLISKVPDLKQRKVLRLKYISGMTMAEIMDILDLPRTTCRSLRDKAFAAATAQYYALT